MALLCVDLNRVRLTSLLKPEINCNCLFVIYISCKDLFSTGCSYHTHDRMRWITSFELPEAMGNSLLIFSLFSFNSCYTQVKKCDQCTQSYWNTGMGSHTTSRPTASGIGYNNQTTLAPPNPWEKKWFEDGWMKNTLFQWKSPVSHCQHWTFNGSG